MICQYALRKIRVFHFHFQNEVERTTRRKVKEFTRYEPYYDLSVLK